MNHIKEIFSEGGWAPFQMEGQTINGHFFYVRIRHGKYSMSLGDTQRSAIGSVHEKDGPFFEIHGYEEDLKGPIREAVESWLCLYYDKIGLGKGPELIKVDYP